MKPLRNNYLTNLVFIIAIFLLLNGPALAYPPDPNNAALLYYQAFLAYEKPNDTIQELVEQVARGAIEPNLTITKYIEGCRPAIELAIAAGELPDCDWGLKYSEGLSMQLSYLSQIKFLTYIILADARIAAKEGNYQLAIERCLTARKLGLQVSQAPATVNFLVNISIEKRTNKCIQDIISNFSIDAKTLQYLEGQLDELNRKHKPIEFFFDTEREVFSRYMTPEKICEVPIDKHDDIRKLILGADKEFCQRNLNYYNELWRAIFSAFKLPYQQAYTELKKLDTKAAQEYKDNTNAIMAVLLTPEVAKIYDYEVYRNTSSNALKAALQIYLSKTQTGQLLDDLPADLPKDLFSGKAFEYKKTVDGFVLRCRGEDLVENKIHEYEFKVK